MRLNLYLARCGVASRRKADELIKKGAVQINSEKAAQPFLDVKTGDCVKVYGRTVAPAGYIYIALNKPGGYTSTVQDRFAEKKVTDLIPSSCGKLFPVGRLDKNSCGLILLTNDGEFANRITHPRYEVEKEYEVLLRPAFDASHVKILREGIEDEGELLRAAGAKTLKNFPGRSLLSVTMKEGKKREIRRLFEALGYRVIELKRVRIGKIYLEMLKPGEYRNLTEQEIKGFGTQNTPPHPGLSPSRRGGKSEGRKKTGDK